MRGSLLAFLTLLHIVEEVILLTKSDFVYTMMSCHVQEMFSVILVGLVLVLYLTV